MTIKIAYHKLFSIEHSLQCHFFPKGNSPKKKTGKSKCHWPNKTSSLFLPYCLDILLI